MCSSDLGRREESCKFTGNCNKTIRMVASMSTATEMLAKYLAAESAVLSGKTVQLFGRSVGREDLAEVRAGRKEWESRVSAETTATAGRTPRAPIYLEF